MNTSQYGAEFNHDPWAEGYDADVQREEHPVRAGYTAVLDWVVAQAAITQSHVVVDLGIGTGNTSLRIPAASRIIGVDLSANMMEIARAKLAHLPVTFVQDDLLAFFMRGRRFDRLISTYAIHHLTSDEKGQLFHHIANALTDGGRAVFGDLMFYNAAAQQQLTTYYANLGNQEMVDTFAEEFFWHVDTACDQLVAAGLIVDSIQQFSQLSWGISTQKPPITP